MTRPEMTFPGWCNVWQVAAAWDCHPETVRRYCRQGIVPAKRIRGSWLVAVQTVKERRRRLASLPMPDPDDWGSVYEVEHARWRALRGEA